MGFVLILALVRGFAIRDWTHTVGQMGRQVTRFFCSTGADYPVGGNCGHASHLDAPEKTKLAGLGHARDVGGGS